MQPMSYNLWLYVYSNPVKYVDSSGRWLETLIDIASIAYDIYDIKKNGLTWGSGLALASDIVSLGLLIVAGGGAIVRAATKFVSSSR